MNRYELAIATADFLESNPKSYLFCERLVPATEYDHGCVLGHMGRIAGKKAGTDILEVSRELTGMHETMFYAHLSAVSSFPYASWQSSASTAAEVLRRLANRSFKPRTIDQDTHYGRRLYALEAEREYEVIINDFWQ